MTFVKGVSGNPLGRPKKNEEMRAALRRVLDQKAPDGRPNREAIALGLVTQARSGNVEAAKMIFDRMDGKVKDETAHEHTGKIDVEVSYTRRPADRLGAPGTPPGPGGDQE